MCKIPIKGRSDKTFCSNECKNRYHTKLRSVTNTATHKTDLILHRNRSILLEILGKNLIQKKVHRYVLDRKKFNFSYITSIHTNKHGKRVYHVYDFSWMIFSDQEILIIHRKNSVN
jgi:hypothetical protein